MLKLDTNFPFSFCFVQKCLNQVSELARLRGRYTHDGSYLAFVNGNDPDFKGQAQHWADDSNCYVRNADPEVRLPAISWPPNFYLATQDQQRYITVEKVQHWASAFLLINSTHHKYDFDMTNVP